MCGRFLSLFCAFFSCLECILFYIFALYQALFSLRFFLSFSLFYYEYVFVLWIRGRKSITAECGVNSELNQVLHKHIWIALSSFLIGKFSNFQIASFFLLQFNNNNNKISCQWRRSVCSSIETVAYETTNFTISFDQYSCWPSKMAGAYENSGFVTFVSFIYSHYYYSFAYQSESNYDFFS